MGRRGPLAITWAVLLDHGRQGFGKLLQVRVRIEEYHVGSKDGPPVCCTVMPVRVVLDISVAVCSRGCELVLVKVHYHNRRVCCFA